VINKRENYAPERVFSPWWIWKKNCVSKKFLVSLESGIAVKDFHVLGFL